LTNNPPNNQSSSVSKDFKGNIKRKKGSDNVCMRESIIRIIVELRMMEMIVRIMVVKMMIKVMIAMRNSMRRKCSWRIMGRKIKMIIGCRRSFR
jgi:hypothetical protein